MKLVLDTSLFGNPEVYTSFVNDRAEAAISILKKLRELSYDVYTTPSVVRELEPFLDVSLLEGLWTVKAPNLTLSIPGYIFVEYVRDLRKRLDKALRIAEEYARKGIKDEKEDIKALRAKFRELVRNGIVDSTTDVELVILALEIDAILVSSDEGLLKFGEMMGCKILNGKYLESFIRNKS